MTQIKNLTQLVANGQDTQTQKARTLALQSLQQALNAVDPKQLLRSKLKFKDGILQVDGFFFNLDCFRWVFVVGGGKAGGAMAEAVEEILGDRIAEGAVNVPRGSSYHTRVVEVTEAGHPVPDEAGVKGTHRIVEIAQRAQETDLIICLLSGGGSSLMPLPREGIALEDLRALTDALLKSGADITEINAVRKHLSAFKGGWLAKQAYPATVLNLVLSDVVGDPLDAIASGPTVPDPSAFADARRVLEKYGLWEGAPLSVQQVLLEGERGSAAETPKSGDPAFTKVCNVVLGNNRYASLAACDYLRGEGLNVALLTATMEGEAKDVGTFLASVAREASASGNPAVRPCAIVAGGETTVTVKGSGLGGRNQELALAAALKLKGAGACVLAALGTDGVDGPTDAAGAVVDGFTLTRAMQAGLDAERFLANNDSYHFFAEIGDLIHTGQTGTNVNDISVIVVL